MNTDEKTCNGIIRDHDWEGDQYCHCTAVLAVCNSGKHALY